MKPKPYRLNGRRRGSWDGEVTVPEPLPDPAQRQRVTIEHAVKAFLAELQESISFGTHKKYRLLLERFKEFSTARGYVMIDQWEPTDVRDFRTSWAINPRTGARRMAMLKPFFEYCVSNEWITRNPARAVKNPKGRDMEKAAQRLPFTDEELKRMYDACPLYGNTAQHKWNGEDVADFISLSIYTGLRISDVALFNIDRMKASGEIRVRTTKTGANVNTLGSQMVAGPHSRACEDPRRLHLWHPHHQRPGRYHRGMAEETSEGLEALRAVEGKAGAT